MRELVAHTVVLLIRPPDAPELPEEELDALQEQHVRYMESLRAAGKLAVNGPFRDQPDERLRGLCVFNVGIDEARELIAGDPSVRAGRMRAELFTWLVPPGLVTFGST